VECLIAGNSLHKPGPYALSLVQGRFIVRLCKTEVNGCWCAAAEEQ
jgi:hypothetical protein